jgi:hypothetical protein
MPGSALHLLDRLTACLRKRALSPTLHESQKAIRVIQRLPGTIMVMMIAITPSLNASSLLFPILPLLLLFTA